MLPVHIPNFLCITLATQELFLISTIRTFESTSKRLFIAHMTILSNISTGTLFTFLCCLSMKCSYKVVLALLYFVCPSLNSYKIQRRISRSLQLRPMEIKVLPELCPNNIQPAGRCICGKCGLGYACINGICCEPDSRFTKCLDGSKAISSCFDGHCGSGYECTLGNICCPVARVPIVSTTVSSTTITSPSTTTTALTTPMSTTPTTTTTSTSTTSTTTTTTTTTTAVCASCTLSSVTLTPGVVTPVEGMLITGPDGCTMVNVVCAGTDPTQIVFMTFNNDQFELTTSMSSITVPLNCDANGQLFEGINMIAVNEIGCSCFNADFTICT